MENFLGVHPQGPTVTKWQMSCCALCQMTASNDSSLAELNFAINKLKDESKYTWNPQDRDSGERAILVITTPHETKLEERLKILKFKHVTTFNRRNGYPDGKLKMWFLFW